jgi:plasmid maintenance system antidote protein VapI
MRRAIRASDLTAYRICQLTDINHATLSRFLTGERGLSMEAIDALADLLGWSLNCKSTSKRRK